MSHTLRAAGSESVRHSCKPLSMIQVLLTSTLPAKRGKIGRKDSLQRYLKWQQPAHQRLTPLKLHRAMDKNFIPSLSRTLRFDGRGSHARRAAWPVSRL